MQELASHRDVDIDVQIVCKARVTGRGRLRRTYGAAYLFEHTA